MRPVIALLPLFVLFACARGEASSPAASTARPILVELFTSQGCSSCPPADRMLAELAARAPADRSVIPLAFHVDYWNHLGWSDPFSSAAWSERQRRYASAFGADRIYTPELVVAGRADVVGTDGGGMRRLGSEAAREPEGATVAVEAAPRSGGAWPVTIRADRLRAADAPAAEVFVALYENGLETTVGSGENAHRKLHNDRVVRRLVRAASLPAGGGSADTRVELPIDPSWTGELGVVAFVQEPSTMRVLAASEAAPAGR
jgi:hypothetical protein